MSADRFILDKAVDWRKVNLPHDRSPIKTNLDPKQLNDCLRLPKPMLGQKYPVTVLYRGFLIAAKVPK